MPTYHMPCPQPLDGGGLHHGWASRFFRHVCPFGTLRARHARRAARVGREHEQRVGRCLLDGMRVDEPTVPTKSDPLISHIVLRESCARCVKYVD
jgi:hypothetical protein